MDELRIALLEAIEQPTKGNVEKLLEVLSKGPTQAAVSKIEQVAQARSLTPAALVAIGVLFCHVAYLKPELMTDKLDKVSEGWLTGRGDLILGSLEKGGRNDSLMPQALKEFFWKQLLTPPDFKQLLQTFATYGSLLDSSVKKAYSESMAQRPGVKEAFEKGYLRSGLEVQSLSKYEGGTLGHKFYQHLVDNSLELEFTKGNRPGTISQLTDYVALRVLQTHDIWHIMLNYSTGPGEELRLLGFQSAQLGTMFSSHVLALAVTQTTLLKPEQMLGVVTAIAMGWQQGRKSVPMLPIEWESLFDQQVVKLREDYQIEPS